MVLVQQSEKKNRDQIVDRDVTNIKIPPPQPILLRKRTRGNTGTLILELLPGTSVYPGMSRIEREQRALCSFSDASSLSMYKGQWRGSVSYTRVGSDGKRLQD